MLGVLGLRGLFKSSKQVLEGLYEGSVSDL